MSPVFEDRIISRRGDVVWPPRCCDLIPLYYYLWGDVKGKCYADKLETIDALKDNIREAIGEIQLHTIVNVLKNDPDLVGYCIAIAMYTPYDRNKNKKRRNKKNFFLLFFDSH